MDHDNRGKRSFTGGSVENALDGLIAALVGNGFAVGGENGRGEQKTER